MASRSSGRLLGKVIFAVARGSSGFAEYQVGVNQRIEPAIEDAVHIADGQLGAMVLDHAVWGQHITADLAAEVDVELRSLRLTRLLALFFQLEFVEPRAQLLHGSVAVLVLRTLVLALNHDAGGEVRDAHRRIGHIDVLAAGAAGAERIDAEIVRLNIDLDFVVDLRVDEDRSERSVAARVGVEWRNAHQAMHTDFRLEQPVGVFAVDFEGNGLDARAFTLEAVRDQSVEALLLGPPKIHAQQHFGPVLAFSAAGAGVNGDDGVAHVVLAREQHRGLDLLDDFGKGLDLAGDIAVDIFALARQFEQRVEVRG